MVEAKTIDIPHLKNTKVGYFMPKPYNAELPTLVMVNSFATSVQLYRPQFADQGLLECANLLAIELFGHGETRTDTPQFTYWDSAIANLLVMSKLGIDQAFVLGTSQGGWVAARMALLAPQRIKGIIPLGTSMDFESNSSQVRGCWDGDAFNTPLIDALENSVSEDWAPDAAFCDALIAAGMGDSMEQSERDFWHKTLKANYKGDAGRRRLRMCAINLRDRDGLYGRLDGVTCPVLWMHGTADKVYSVENAQDGIKRFTSSPNATLQIVEGGQHFLSASDPMEVNAASIRFIRAN